MYMCVCSLDEYISVRGASCFCFVCFWFRFWEKFCVENFLPGSKTKAQITVAIFGVFYYKYMYIIYTNMYVCVRVILFLLLAASISAVANAKLKHFRCVYKKRK